MSNGFLDGPDVDLAHIVVEAADIAVIGRADSTREQVRAQLASPEAAVDEHRLVLDEAQRPVGLLMLECDAAARRIFADSYCVPGFEGSVLGSLIVMGIDSGRRLSEGAPGWEIEAGIFAEDLRYAAELRRQGFEAVRRFWRMGIDLSDHPGVEPQPPAGVHRSIAVRDSDRRLLHSIHESSFAEHFGSVARPYEQWLPWFSDRQDAAPELWWLAWLDGEPVAEITQDHSRADRNATYIRTLGVAPHARGRGIGRWLLECAFADAAQRGRQRALLSVDSDNTTGATRLYEGVGMTSEEIMDLYRRPLDSLG
jgi:ribosomal protein S18 acetylase RimI-like enzyme